MRRFLWLFPLIAFSWGSSVQAQQLTPFVVASSGGYFEFPGGSLSATVGEMAAIETYTNPSLVLTQGFQQPWDLGTAVSDVHGVDMGLRLYPNPSNGPFYLLLESPQSLDLQVRITDLMGREILHFSFRHQDIASVIPVDLTGVPDGLYMISLYGQLTSANTFTYAVGRIHIVH